MDFKWLALLSFVVHLWPKLNIIHHIQQHYGTEKLQLYRRLERTLLKLRKVQQDIAFLVNCQKFSLIPTFCRIKPANHASMSARDKLSLQKRLLCLELKSKRRTCNQLSNVYQQLKDDFKQSVGFFTYLWSLQCLWSKAKSDSLIVTDRHAKKIRNLKSRHGSDMLSFFEWMNKQHPSITFTKEEEQDNKLSFLDVLLTRTTDGSIVTSIYRKPTFSGLYMKWDSFVPKSYKKGLVNCLVFRAWKLCSSYVLFHSEILFVKELLMSNGYPANFIDSIVHRFLSKQFSNTDVMQPYGPHKRRVYLFLPYVGELATNKFARQIRRLIAKIAPCVELRLVFRAAQKLSCLTRLKSKLNVLSRSGVVYQISCSQCEAFYVGKTKRRLEQRVQEHSQQGYSSLYKHSSDLCHQIDYSNPAVISVDNNDYRLQIKEALKIKDLKAYNSLNANIRSCELKLW